MSVYLIIFGIFMVGMLYIGYLSLKQSDDTAADFYVAGRKMSAWVVAGTYGASFMSAGSFIGTTGINYAYGVSALWQLGGTLLAVGFVGLVLGHKFWRFGYYNEGYTLPDVFSARYAKRWSRGMFAVVILILYTFGLGAMYLGFYSVLGTVSNIPFEIVIVIAASVIIIFTYMGGSRAVAWTDTAQLAIMIFAVAASTATVLYLAGGWGNLMESFINTPPAPEGSGWASGSQLAQPVSTYFTRGISIGWFSIWFFGNISQPHQITRMYLAKNEKEARKAIAFVCVPFVLIYLTTMIIGAYARVLDPALTKIDFAFPSVIVSIFPDVLAAVILMGLVAAIMSTASTMLVICSMSTSHDIYGSLINPKATDKQKIKMSRYTIIIIGILSIIIAMIARNLPGLLFLWSAAFAIMGSAIFPSLLAAFYWKRANGPGNITSMLVGTLTSLLLYVAPTLRPFGLHPILPALFLSTITLIIVSLLTKEPEKEVIDKFFNEKMARYF